MTFFKNKHVITAMIVAPVLAVVTYFVVDSLVKEQPHVAQEGQAYKLIAKSNCRFTSGECDLENASFKSNLTVDKETGLLTLKSSHSLQSAMLGFVDSSGTETNPVSMTSANSEQTMWQASLPEDTAEDTVARLALQANNAFYFAETGMRFAEYETSFNKDLRKTN